MKPKTWCLALALCMLTLCSCSTPQSNAAEMEQIITSLTRLSIRYGQGDIGPKHSTWTPFRLFWGRLSQVFLGIGFIFLGIWNSCILKKRISKFIIWGLLLLLFCIFEQIYIRRI